MGKIFESFGKERVIETPIAEAAVVGAAAGAAMYGMRPVAELQFIDFISCAGFDQLVTVAAKSRYRNGVGCPIVLRGPAGGGLGIRSYTVRDQRSTPRRFKPAGLGYCRYWITHSLPRSSKLMATGCRTIGSCAKTDTSNPAGNCIF